MKLRKLSVVFAMVAMAGMMCFAQAAEGDFSIGDVDCDGKVGDITDVVLVGKHLAGRLTLSEDSQNYKNANCNLDGEENAASVNIDDLKLLIDYMLGAVDVLPYPEGSGEPDEPTPTTTLATTTSATTTSETTTPALTTIVEPVGEFAPYIDGMDETEFADWGAHLKIFLNIGGFEGHYTLDTVSTDLVKVVQEGVTQELNYIEFKSLTSLEIQPLTAVDEGTLDIYYDGIYMGRLFYPEGTAVTGTAPPAPTTTSTTTRDPNQPPADDSILETVSVNETESADWINFYKRSLYSMGNTSRLVEKMSLAKAGEPITVGFLGGSFTVGVNSGNNTTAADSYAVLVHRYFAQTFGTGSNVSYVNAGLSGTNSITGLARVDHDLFSKNPDVIFIEYAVNDDGSNADCKTAFDALIAKAVSLPNNPAVIVQINRPGYQVGGTQQYMVATAAKYDVPVVSINDAVNGGNPSNDYISGDNLHPSNNGHAIIAKTVQYFLREVVRTRAQYAVSPPSIGAIPGLAGTTLKTSANLGSFNSTMQKTTDYGYNANFPENYSGNGTISFTTQGKGVIVTYKGTGQSANISVNGSSVTARVGNSWGGAESIIAYNSETTQELNVTISGNITILGISIAP